MPNRAEDYGPPDLNHECTASLWNAYLRYRWQGSMHPTLDAYDICILNILQKVSRAAWKRLPDHLEDIIGYAENAQFVLSTSKSRR